MAGQEVTVYRSDALIPKPYHGRRLGTYDEALASALLHHIAHGGSQIEWCDQHDVGHGTVSDWVLDNVQGYGGRYARARLKGCYYINEYCLQIADDSRNDWMLSNHPDDPGWKYNGEAVMRTRMRLEQRRFFLSKMAPKIFGDKLDLTTRPSEETGGVAVQHMSQASPKQLEALEQVARLCQRAGIQIEIRGFTEAPLIEVPTLSL